MATVSVVFKVIVELAAFVAVGFIGFRVGILSRKTAIELGNFTINITLPFLIFSSMMRKFPQVMNDKWYILPFLELILTGSAFFVAWMVLRFLKPKTGAKEFYLISSFQNGAFFPIAVVSSLFSKDVAESYYIYIFLFVLFFGPLIITVSKLLFSGKPPVFKNILNSIVNPVFVSVFVSIFLVYTGFYRIIPDFLIDISYKIGNVTIPIILFTLGGSLYYAYRTNITLSPSYILWAVLIKLVIIPGLVFVSLFPLKLPSYIKIVFMLEAASPTAVNSATYSMVYGGNDALVSKVTVFVYIVSLVTYPLFVMLAISKFG